MEMSECIGEKCTKRWGPHYGIQVMMGKGGLGHWQRVIGAWAMLMWDEDTWIWILRQPVPRRSREPSEPPPPQTKEDLAPPSGNEGLPPPPPEDKEDLPPPRVREALPRVPRTRGTAGNPLARDMLKPLTGKAPPRGVPIRYKGRTSDDTSTFGDSTWDITGSLTGSLDSQGTQSQSSEASVGKPPPPPRGKSGASGTASIEPSTLDSEPWWDSVYAPTTVYDTATSHGTRTE